MTTTKDETQGVVLPPRNVSMMRGSGEIDSEELRAAVDIANIPTLIPVLVTLTGDDSWLAERYRPIRRRGIENSLGDNDDAGLPPEVQAEIRDAAFDAITGWLDAGRPAPVKPAEGMLSRVLAFSMAEPVPDDYEPVLQSLMGFVDDEDMDVAVPPGFRVAIIGAGASGLAMGVELLRAGIPFQIFEQEAALGGTWLHNRYPGCGVDSPNHLYSFSFYRYDWPAYFSLRDTLCDYFELLATDLGLRPFIQFNTNVPAVRFREESQDWELTLEQEGKPDQSYTADVLVSAVGAFAATKLPDIPGIESFQGTVVHSGDYPLGLDLVGKRVAVVGNGASAMQLVPAIADEVSEMVILQRTPQWVAPFEKFHKQVPQPLRSLMAAIPAYRDWYRVRLAWAFNDQVHPVLKKDPNWTDPDRSLNAKNDKQRRFFEQYIREQLGDRDDLIDQLIPDYPPFGKRMLFDNGWYQTLLRDNVSLNSTGAAALTETGIVGGDGKSYDVDVVIFATGFDVVRFLSSIDVTGRDGITIRDVWGEDDAQSYIGLTVPKFPNLFTLYGPNVQAGHGGSFLNKAEMQIRYVRQVLQYMFQNNLGEIECRPDVHEAYNAEIQEAHQDMVWLHPRVSTYYKNAKGRVVVNTPWRTLEFWQRAAEFNPEDYVFTPSKKAVANSTPTA